MTLLLVLPSLRLSFAHVFFQPHSSSGQALAGRIPAAALKPWTQLRVSSCKRLMWKAELHMLQIMEGTKSPAFPFPGAMLTIFSTCRTAFLL
jgi:hypothetical protein